MPGRSGAAVGSEAPCVQELGKVFLWISSTGSLVPYPGADSALRRDKFLAIPNSDAFGHVIFVAPRLLPSFAGTVVRFGGMLPILLEVSDQYKYEQQWRWGWSPGVMRPRRWDAAATAWPVVS
eukprot:764515-Hanusia_phi.AAC.6